MSSRTSREELVERAATISVRREPISFVIGAISYVLTMGGIVVFIGGFGRSALLSPWIGALSAGVGLAAMVSSSYWHKRRFLRAAKAAGYDAAEALEIWGAAD